MKTLLLITCLSMSAGTALAETEADKTDTVQDLHGACTGFLTLLRPAALLLRPFAWV